MFNPGCRPVQQPLTRRRRRLIASLPHKPHPSHSSTRAFVGRIRVAACGRGCPRVCTPQACRKRDCIVPQGLVARGHATTAGRRARRSRTAERAASDRILCWREFFGGRCRSRCGAVHESPNVAGIPMAPAHEKGIYRVQWQRWMGFTPCDHSHATATQSTVHTAPRSVASAVLWRSALCRSALCLLGVLAAASGRTCPAGCCRRACRAVAQ